MDDERARSVGFPLIGEAGLLLAFRPNLVHEVTPVTHGERCTVVTWFE
jgi:SM-20-related protein